MYLSGDFLQQVICHSLRSPCTFYRIIRFVLFCAFFFCFPFWYLNQFDAIGWFPDIYPTGMWQWFDKRAREREKKEYIKSNQLCYKLRHNLKLAHFLSYRPLLPMKYFKQFSVAFVRPILLNSVCTGTTANGHNEFTTLYNTVDHVPNAQFIAAARGMWNDMNVCSARKCLMKSMKSKWSSLALRQSTVHFHFHSIFLYCLRFCRTCSTRSSCFVCLCVCQK